MKQYRIYYTDKYHAVHSVIYDTEAEYLAIKFGRGLFSDRFVTVELIPDPNAKDSEKSDDKNIWAGYSTDDVDD